MSLSVKTTEGEVVTHFVGIPIDGVSIGKHEIPLEHFCIMARHFLSGGLFGWGGKTPICVNDALTFLFDLHKQDENGKWVRRSPEELINPDHRNTS